MTSYADLLAHVRPRQHPAHRCQLELQRVEALVPLPRSGHPLSQSRCRDRGAPSKRERALAFVEPYRRELRRRHPVTLHRRLPTRRRAAGVRRLPADDR